MSQKPRRLAIIPARGGSKRIYQKNISKFHGQPIIYYTLQAAQASELFDKIHVSTESSLVFDIAKNLGFEPDFFRPIELAADDTPLFPVLRYVVDKFVSLGIIFDEVWMLMPCAPLITKRDLFLASKLFAQTGGPILSVCEYPAPIEWAYQKKADGRLYPALSEKSAIRSQDLGIKYYDAGIFAIYNAKDLMDDISLGGDLIFYGFHIDRIKAIDIDYQSDWDHAEEVFRLINSTND